MREKVYGTRSRFAREVSFDKEKEYKLNKEIRDKFVLAGYLRHPRL
jgi:hypothetical protein